MRKKFVYSRNTEVTKHLNPKTGKLPTNGNFTSFNSNWEPVETEIGELALSMGDSHGLCAWHLLDGKRVANNTGCIQAGLIIIDIDNQADYKDDQGNKVHEQHLSVEEALELDICKKYLSLLYLSPSSTKDWERFRLVFALEKPIIDTGFYDAFQHYVAQQIPGHDPRALQVPNLFYGSTNNGVLYTSDKYIPSDTIVQAHQQFLAAPRDTSSVGNAEERLITEVDSEGVDIRPLLSGAVRAILAGDPVEDRSFSMAMAFKEVIGWTNWANQQGIRLSEKPLEICEEIFQLIYDYPSDLDGKFQRILNSISDAEDLQPAISIASEHGDLAAWKRLRTKDQQAFDKHCPSEVQSEIRALRPTPVSSILDFDAPVSSTSTATSQEPDMAPKASTPDTPAQLVDLQTSKKAFADNDVADILVKNNGDDFLFDDRLDEFFKYDHDAGVWGLTSEFRMKQSIIRVLDTMVQAGLLTKYSNQTVTSIYSILKGKLLKFHGSKSIWAKNKGKIMFDNGYYDVHDQKFFEGKYREEYFQTKLGYQFDPASKCPDFLGWLDHSVGTDKKILIQAFCKAVLTGYTSGEKFLHLIGPGGSGKSTLQQVLIALAGYTGTHTSDLDTLETNRFEAHALIGKRLLVLTDEAAFSKRLDTLKKLTSASDTMRAERKYGKEVVSFKPDLLVVIASNEHISSSDISSGLERRRLTIVMDKPVDASQRRDLLSVYADEFRGDFAAELPGIAQWCLQMDDATMRDVLANPVKHVPALRISNLDALVFNNPIVGWLAECTLYAPNSKIKFGTANAPSMDEKERGLYVRNAHTEFYPSYVNYCKAGGYRPISRDKFTDRFKETVNNVLKCPGIQLTFHEGIKKVSGIRIRPQDQTTDRACTGVTRLPSPVEFVSNPTGWDKAFEEHDKA